MNALDALIDAERPWPGLLPFTEDARAWFHGREVEASELTRLIEREPLTVLFGQSGLGKSSLLNAGVFPLLRRAGHLPVYLRLNLDAGAPALIEQVWQTLKDECARHDVSASAPTAGDSFWTYLHRQRTQLSNPHGRAVTPVLVFDQFEEIFTLGRLTPEQNARCQVFLQELGELIENRLPQRLEAELTEHPEALDDYDLLRQNLKIVFAFREDYLAEFEGLKTRIRPIMQNRMRLTPMSGSRAALAIQQAGADKVSAAVAARIVRFVGAGGSADASALDQIQVEPALLSLVCRELNEQRIARGEAVISADLIQGDNTQQIIEQFYRQGFAGVDLEVRHFVEDRLLTAAGYRDSCALDNALAEPGISEAALQTLVDRRILRREERGGRVRLELIHDVLAGVAKASREQRRAEEALAEAKRQIARQKRRQRWLILAAAVFLTVVAVISWLALTAIQARDAAQKRTAELEQVFKFQREMLAQVDVFATGQLLSNNVKTQFAEALTRTGMPEGERAAQVAAFAANWQRVNATDAALQLIDNTILKPAADAVEKEFKDQPLVDASVNQSLADRYAALGLYASAQSLQERVLAIYRRVLGPEHYNTLASMVQLGDLLIAQGRWSEAEAYQREVLEITRRVSGEEHPNTLTSISNLSFVLQAQGRLSEAETLLLDVVEKHRRVSGGEHPNTLISISQLSGVLQDQGRLSEAEALLREALEKLRRVLGENHPQTLNVISNLGRLLQEQGKLSAAEPYYRETLEKSRTALGEEHPNTLNSIINMASLRDAQGQHVEAVEMLVAKEAVMRTAFTGRNAFALGKFLTTLGKARTGVSQFSLAEASLLEAHAILVLTPGHDPKYLRDCHQALIGLYRAWHEAMPDKGYDVKASEWELKLTESGASLPAPVVAKPVQ